MNREPKFTVREERERIHERYPNSTFDDLSIMLDRQFQMLQARGHALLVLCGLLVTGNALIGSLFQSRVWGALLLVFRLGGGAFAVAAAAVTMIGVMRLKWITQYPGDTIDEWLDYALTFRNEKTRSFKIASIFVLISVCLYECAILVFVLSK